MSAAEPDRVEIVPFSPDREDEVVALIVAIQRGEFEIDIDLARQPDLREIPAFYQTGAGNFWVALHRHGRDDPGRVVGTIALLDIGERQGALRKMFVQPDFRGARFGTAGRLLSTLLSWAAEHGIDDVFLGTTPFFHAAHRFYEKHGFAQIDREALPVAFPIMEVDTRFYRRSAVHPTRTHSTDPID